MASETITAIDISSRSLNVLSVKQSGKKVRIVGAGTLALDPTSGDDPAEIRIVGNEIQHMVKKSRIPLGTTVVGLSGRGSMLRYTEMPIAPRERVRMMIRFELEEEIHADLEQVAYDFHNMQVPSYDEDTLPVMLAMGQVPVIEQRFDLCRKILRGDYEADLQGLGVFNLFRRSVQCDEEENSVMLTLGPMESFLTLHCGDELMFARCLSVGTVSFSKRLEGMAERGEISEEFAHSPESLRIIPKEDEEMALSEVGAASRACRQEAASMARLIVTAIDFFRKQYGAKDLKFDRFFINMAEARIEGLDNDLTERLPNLVEEFDAAEAMRLNFGELPFEDEEAPRYAAAAGMALARLKSGIVMRMIPPAIIAKRKFWRNDIYVPFAAIACAIIMVALCYSSRKSLSLKTERNDKWTKHLKKASAEEKQLVLVSDKNEKLGEKVEKLIARKRSGVLIVQLIDILRRKTPNDVFFTRFWTESKNGSSSRSRGRTRTTRPDDDKLVGSPPDHTDAENSYIMLEGYIVGAKDEPGARQKLDSFADLLQEAATTFPASYMRKVTTIRLEVIAEVPDEVKALYKAKMKNAKQKPLVKISAPPKGTMLSFIIRCETGDK